MPRYTMQFRPPGFATLPPDVQWEWVEAPANGTPAYPTDIPLSRHPFGVFDANRALTDKEMKDFQVTKVAEENERVIVFRMMGAGGELDRHGVIVPEDDYEAVTRELCAWVQGKYLDEGDRIYLDLAENLD